MRAVELFCGIGGLGLALREAAPGASVVAAYDVDNSARATYEENHGLVPSARNLETIPAAEAEGWRADLWLASPPCGPFTERGARRDDDDPRARPLLRLAALVAEVRPASLFVENVPGFAGSRTAGRLLETLGRAGYECRCVTVCPTELGIPNRRLRRYVLASRAPLRAAPPLAPRVPPRPLRDFVDTSRDADPDLRLDPALAARIAPGLDVADSADPAAVAACFARSYGRMHLRGGSYLRLRDGGLRRFAPEEVLRLLGFPPGFRFPAGFPRRTRWRLAGNSVSVPAAARALAGLAIAEAAA